MSDEPIETKYEHSKRNEGNHSSQSFFTFLAPYLWTIVAIFIVTAIIRALRPAFDLVDAALLYLLPVLISAVRWGRWTFSFRRRSWRVLVFDFFFVPPVLSLTVHDVRHVFVFAMFLLVAIVTGTMATKLRN